MAKVKFLFIRVSLELKIRLELMILLGRPIGVIIALACKDLFLKVCIARPHVFQSIFSCTNLS